MNTDIHADHIKHLESLDVDNELVKRQIFPSREQLVKRILAATTSEDVIAQLKYFFMRYQISYQKFAEHIGKNKSFVSNVMSGRKTELTDVEIDAIRATLFNLYGRPLEYSNFEYDEVVFIVRKLVEQKDVIDMLIPLERDFKASEIHAEYKTQFEARDKSVARLVYSLISVIVLLMGALAWSLLR